MNLTNDQADRIIVRPNWFVMFLLGGIIRRTAVRVVERAFERGHINSSAYHNLHAIIARSL